MQERHNSIANALGYVFLVLSHPYKECNFWVTTPPPYYFFQCNEFNMIVAIFYHWSMYWAYSIKLYELNYIATRHIESTVWGLSNSWYTTISTTSNTYTVYIDYWSQADGAQSLHVNPLICHWYCFALVWALSSGYLNMMGVDKYWCNSLNVIYLFPYTSLRHMESICLSFDWYQSAPYTLFKHCCIISGRNTISEQLKDLRMYKCILLTVTVSGPGDIGRLSCESSYLAGAGPSQSVTSPLILA